MELNKLPNIGPELTRLLNEVEIRDSEELRACLKSFDKRRREADNREKQAGVGENASISK